MKYKVGDKVNVRFANGNGYLSYGKPLTVVEQHLSTGCYTLRYGDGSTTYDPESLMEPLPKNVRVPVVVYTEKCGYPRAYTARTKSDASYTARDLKLNSTGAKLVWVEVEEGTWPSEDELKALESMF